MGRKAIGLLALVVAMAALAGPAVASATLNLNGSFFVPLLKPGGAGPVCPAGVDGNQCGMMQLAGLGPADFIYKFGPTFDPTGYKGCFYIDGTFTIILQSDGSTISGPLTGVFCTPGYSGLRGRPYAYGNPFSENDSVALTSGTGQFLGLHGTANYQQSAAGAAYRGTLIGTLVGD